ncbi:SDR family oxidoreductase [Actinocorallia sp. A-T 12471]|uniref:SDR family oxidoreductase n=1 Tax=Actinocorallia sp. A-T 12471 TaxID=3089813 RepID=UPI0029CF3E58|nr:NAD(P)H-binding protein [Actinocorallia sp. A-T 12471]MDX6739208.1 NAD(P)H-binding protein [Actinocorallia sp. A-T 12471]
MIVVTGATGNVGRHLVQTLVEAGEDVTAVSRHVADAPEGVRRHKADLTSPETLRPALRDAEALFLLTSADFMAHGDMNAVMDVVRASGVGRVVLLSSQGVGTGRHPSDLEDAVKDSGLEWTMLRPGNFASNAFQWAESIRASRTALAPFGDVALPTIDPLDIAEAAAVVLREPGHAGAAYTLTGPTPITPREQVAAIADALGDPIHFIEETPEAARTRMLTFMPPPVVTATLAVLGSPTPTEQTPTPDLTHLLTRPPHPFTTWTTHNTQPFK